MDRDAALQDIRDIAAHIRKVYGDGEAPALVLEEAVSILTTPAGAPMVDSATVVRGILPRGYSARKGTDVWEVTLWDGKKLRMTEAEIHAAGYVVGSKPAPAASEPTIANTCPHCGKYLTGGTGEMPIDSAPAPAADGDTVTYYSPKGPVITTPERARQFAYQEYADRCKLARVRPLAFEQWDKPAPAVGAATPEWGFGLVAAVLPLQRENAQLRKERDACAEDARKWRYQARQYMEQLDTKDSLGSVLGSEFVAVHYWMPNEENHLESLSCPVVIPAEWLRNLLEEAKAGASTPPVNARETLVRNMAAAMRHKLNTPSNLAKGDNWGDLTTYRLFALLDAEVEELKLAARKAVSAEADQSAVAAKRSQETGYEAADVANIAAMIADKVGAWGRATVLQAAATPGGVAELLHGALNDLLALYMAAGYSGNIVNRAFHALALRPDLPLTAAFAEEVRALAQGGKAGE